MFVSIEKIYQTLKAVFHRQSKYLEFGQKYPSCESHFQLCGYPDETLFPVFDGNISKTSASVSSGVPNTEKVMKARGRRPSAFIVSRCLEPLMKHEARVFDMASQ